MIPDRDGGLTLLELIIVIVILGILTTLGYIQYGRTVEKGRTSEVVVTIGQIRTRVEAYFLEHGGLINISNADVGIGTSADQIPLECVSTHYYNYTLATLTPTRAQIQATRCISGGKPPQSAALWRIYMDWYPVWGTISWDIDAGYEYLKPGSST